MGIIDNLRRLANTDIKQLFQKKNTEVVTYQPVPVEIPRTELQPEIIVQSLFPGNPEQQRFTLNVLQQARIEKELQDNLKTNTRVQQLEDKPKVPTRYYQTRVTEIADPGRYGYATRSFHTQQQGMQELEDCYNHPKVRQCMNRVIDEIFGDELVLNSDSDQEEAQEIQAYNEHLKDEIEGDMEDMLEKAATISLFCGVYIGECIPKWSTDNAQFAGKRVINFVNPIRNGLVEFITDDYDRPLYIHSLVNYSQNFELDRFFILRFGGLWDEVYGGPLFDVVYKPWKGIQIVEDDMLVTSNRYSQPMPNVTYTRPELQAKAQRIADNLYAGVHLALPEGVTAGFIDAGIRGENPHIVIIEYLERQISYGICGYDLSQEHGTGFADEAKKEEKKKKINRIRRKICSAYNEQIIRRWTKHNYPLDVYPLSLYPKARFHVEEQINQVELTETTAKDIENGAVDFEARPNDLIFYRKKRGWPDLSQSEIDERMKRAESIKFDEIEPETDPVIPETDKEAELALFNYGVD